jgi:hypothetical protein
MTVWTIAQLERNTSDGGVVVAWVEAAMGEDEVQAKKDSIDAQIASLVTPTSVTKTLTT